MNTETRIVVLGAGYTGMLAAVRLARRTRGRGVHITIVNPVARFTERLRMHQVAAGQELTDYRIPDLLRGTGIEFLQGRATAIDPVLRRVTVDDTRLLDYDHLIYALGGVAATDTVPGAAEYACTLDNPVAVHHFSRRAAEIAAHGGAVAVIGGGLTGIEAATEIAAGNPGLRITLISDAEPGAMMGERARRYLNRALDRLGIARVIGSAVAEVRPDAVELASGERISADLTLWTAGVRGVPLAAQSGIATDERGLILVDQTLKSLSHPEIHAVGDAAAVRMPWGPLHGTCQSGMPTAAYTADAIARELRGKPVRPFRFGYIHQPVSLGRNDAVIQFTHRDDTPRRWYLTGRAAVRYKEMVSGSPVPVFRLSKKMNVTVTLPAGEYATAA
ncbi:MULTISPECIES: NAD(P)/FAD-dependent oxidoreductase [unclassified Nocardia]|uniref:NAD(P)/FAD-dependent oxidoreductase n=1 Tax=unclassified Nocardia TaxID=2637762 RepID=UPI001CE44F81|nr:MULTISPECIES: FAD-dependent oxidoreductase [unclassified Nocardia]